MITRIVNGGVNMPAYGSSLKPDELDAVVSFLQSRTRTRDAMTTAGQKQEAAKSSK